MPRLLREIVPFINWDIKSEISFLSGTEMKCCSFILKRIRGGLKVMKATPRATELRVEIKTRAFESVLMKIVLRINLALMIHAMLKCCIHS